MVRCSAKSYTPYRRRRHSRAVYAPAVEQDYAQGSTSVGIARLACTIRVFRHHRGQRYRRVCYSYASETNTHSWCSIIALLLGRFRLSIEDAIACYTRIVGQVLTHIKADGSFKKTLFEKVLREICLLYGNGEQMPMLDTLPAPCRA